MLFSLVGFQGSLSPLEIRVLLFLQGHLTKWKTLVVKCVPWFWHMVTFTAQAPDIFLGVGYSPFVAPSLCGRVLT